MKSDNSWGKIKIIQRPKDMPIQQLATGDDLAVLFGKPGISPFCLDLQKARSNFEIMTVSLTAPFHGRKGIKYSAIEHRLTYGIVKDEGTRAVIVFDTGSQVATKVFPYGHHVNKPLADITKLLRFDPPQQDTSVEVTLTITIYAERKAAKNALILTVDVLDLRGVPA